jgi:hypothetical protein
MHPYNGGTPLARYLEIGEVRFNAEQKDEAMQWISDIRMNSRC